MSQLITEQRPEEAAERRKAIVLRVVRAAFLVLMVTFSLLAALQQQQSDKPFFGSGTRWWVPMLISLVVAVFLFGSAIAIDLATPKKKIATITGVILGIVAGVLATVAIGFIIDLLLESWVQNSKAIEIMKPLANFLKVLIGITLSYIGVTTVLQTQDDFRLVIPYVEFSKQIRGVRPMLIDTSALIDGRFADVASTGFLQAPLVIPRFVIVELQALSDSTDTAKRAKGRRGLEFISKMQRTPRLDVTIDETKIPGKAVDQMLVELARMMPAVVVTTDVGLAQVAKIAGVTVLNLNDLANALKSSLVPGEIINVKLVRPGEQAGQGVGYLADGAMVVAENGSEVIGRNVDMVVTSSLQTSAGRLIFARIPDDSPALGPVDPDQESTSQGGSNQLSSDSPQTNQSLRNPTTSSETTSPSASVTQGQAEVQPPINNTPAPHATQPTTDPAAESPARSPFPPSSAFRPTRPGSPRNPRRG